VIVTLFPALITLFLDAPAIGLRRFAPPAALIVVRDHLQSPTSDLGVELSLPALLGPAISLLPVAGWRPAPAVRRWSVERNPPVRHPMPPADRS
jgi:hypothetical protein